MHEIKTTYANNGKEALTGDWEKLNKETHVCSVCLQNRFTSALIFRKGVQSPTSKKHSPT